jgi:tetratricopeptide (TPR) repeat protein
VSGPGLAQEHGEALRAVLTDLPAGQDGALLHLLLCPLCHSGAVLLLQEELDEGEAPDYSLVWQRIEERLPRLIEQADERLAEAAELLDDLLCYAPDQQSKVLGEPKFHSRLLLELLFERSRAAQPLDPRRAEALASLAAELGLRLFRGDLEGEEAALLQSRAANLAGNARRLLGQPDAAESALGRSAHFLAFTWGQSLEGVSLCRYLGLLRWEQGRLDEAEALLRQSARSFGELVLPCEEAASRALLGLLSLERNRTGRAIRLLQASRPALDPEARPWLTVRAGLSLALGLAEAGRLDQARQVLAETAQHKPWVTDEREQTRLSWLEGQVLARLGQPEEAEPLLDTARRRLFAEHRLPEVALCSLDLAVLLVAAGRASELPRLVRDIEATFAAEPALDVIRQMCRDFAASVAKTSQVPPAHVAEAAFRLRRVFRFRGYRVEPLPFV